MFYVHFSSKWHLFISVDLSQKLKCHILVGSPKEMVSLKIMRHFNIEQISLCVIDDGDVVCTTNLIKEHIIKNLENCRLVLISSNVPAGILTPPYAMLNGRNCLLDMDVQQCYMKCTVGTKFLVVESLHAMLLKENAQAIIFCSVSRA